MTDHPDTPEPVCTCDDPETGRGFDDCPEHDPDVAIATDEVRVSALSGSDIASAEEGIAMASRIEPVAVAPEGGQPDTDDELLADYLAKLNALRSIPRDTGRVDAICDELEIVLRHWDLLRIALKATRRELAEAREELEVEKATHAVVEKRSAHLLAEARSHGEALLRGVATVIKDTGDGLTIRVVATETTGRTLSAAEPGPVDVVVVRDV